MSSPTPPAESHAAQQKPKRPVCLGCNFPAKTCICPSLPSEPLTNLFRRCRIVVLQHPHELRRKNRSLPLVELCLTGKGNLAQAAKKTHHNDSSKDTPAEEEDFVMKTVVSRRFGDHCDSAVMKVLRDPDEVTVLVFPHKEAINLEEGIRLAEERCGYTNMIDEEEAGDKNGEMDGSKEEGVRTDPNLSDTKETTPQKKMTLIFIDSTWKLAREMETRTDEAGEWPKNLIRVQMTPSASVNGTQSSDQCNAGDAGSKTGDNNVLPTFIERRFHIRTPPSPDHLSTAECLAWIASRVENNATIYQSILKSLDYMVALWKSFTADNRGSKVRGFTDGDGCWDSMSQKKRKIKQNVMN